ncbi:MAG: hypothetical protein WC627_02670 [Legionella sp.]|jgi:hypothetical protein
MPNYNEFESSLSLSMLQQVLKNPRIIMVLTAVATRARTEVLPLLSEQMHPAFAQIIGSLAMQHSMEDKYIGALLPEYSSEYLKSTPEGQKLLLTSIDNCLKSAQFISSRSDFLVLMKVIDGMAHTYDLFQQSKANLVHIHCREYIAPTMDEVAIRKPRQQDVVAITYGIGTDMNTDLVLKESGIKSCFSGKARFFIPPTEQRKRVWFEKLADQSSVNKPSLPLIASPSNAAAKSIILTQVLNMFVQDNGKFDLSSAQMFANCLMAYLVYCGHHSVLEVMEIWSRQLDFLAIEHPEQLPSGIIPKNPTTEPYFQEVDAVERKLPYAVIGNYPSFLHPLYADSVMDCAHNRLSKGLDLRIRAPIKLTIPSKAMDKYNAKTFFEIRFTEENLNLLKNKYRQVRGLPPYIHNTLKGRPNPDKDLILEHPHLYACSDDFSMIIMPNRNMNWSNLKSNPLAQKNDPDGLPLVGWIIDPRLLANYGLNNRNNTIKTIRELIIKNSKTQTTTPEFQYFQRTNSQEDIGKTESINSESPYLATILDLTPQHIPLLQMFKEISRKHLIDNFGVDFNHDLVEMYFHFPYPEYTTTLHMHIRVNQGRHPMEKNRTFSFEEILNCLEKGNKISQLILNRKPYYTDNYEILTEIEGLEMIESINPFILQNNVIPYDFATPKETEQSNVNCTK